MRETDTLLWHVHAADGELIATTRYAIHAAGLALALGQGARATHCGRVMLDVRERSTKWAAADEAAKAMIDLAYGRLKPT